MPPVRPSKKFYNGHLHRLFRSEFVSNYHKPLCSDAFSGFIIHDPKFVRFLSLSLFLSLSRQGEPCKHPFSVDV
jgi:hypothetical protein